jgi:hypothetical protein
MSCIIRIRTRTIVIVVGLALCGLHARTEAATKVAVIDDGIDSTGSVWCSFLNDNGYECTLFPPSGPTTSLDTFAVVIDMSGQWTDSNHLLADVMASGRGVITWGRAPAVLGIDTDPIVQAWIGANVDSFGSEFVKTTAVDSILGNLVPGTIIGNSGKFGAWALDDTSGHDDAKVLARHNSGTSTIAILRNRWTGQSVYLSNPFILDDVQAQILFRAIDELSVRTIPTTTTWGLIVLAMSMVTGGSILLRRKFSPGRVAHPSRQRWMGAR